MDGMLDAESQQEIQLLLSWMKGLSLLCISLKKRQKFRNTQIFGEHGA